MVSRPRLMSHIPVMDSDANFEGNLMEWTYFFGAELREMYSNHRFVMDRLHPDKPPVSFYDFCGYVFQNARPLLEPWLN
jgi:hypothetical protein